MRKQEKEKLIELCNLYDLDWQAFDYEAYGYRDIKRQILRDAHVKTAEMEEEELEGWESFAEFFDSRPIEEKIVSADGKVVSQTLPRQCFVILINRRYVSLGLAILETMFKGNLHKYGVVRKKDKRGRPIGGALVWIQGTKETVMLIKEELGKHNIYYRVLRDSPFRRNFLHYFNGKFYGLKRSVMKQVTRRASTKLS